MFSWGNNFNGELGRNEGIICDPKVKQITGFPESTRIIKIASGPHHSLAISSIGEVFGWGLGTNGQLGIPNYKCCTPIKIPYLKNAMEICCGSNFSVVLDSNYELHILGHKFSYLKLNRQTIQLPNDKLMYQIGCVENILLATWHSGHLIRDFTRSEEKIHYFENNDTLFQSLEESFLEITNNTYKHLKLHCHHFKIIELLISRKWCDVTIKYS